MPTNYPTALDDLPSPTETDSHNTPGLFHDVLHANMADAMEAVQGELGLTPSGVLATVAARLDQIDTRMYDVRAYGAVLGVVSAGQRTTNLAALHSARDAVTAASGGTILIPGILEVDGMCNFEDLGDTRIALVGSNGIFSGNTIRAHAAVTYLFSLKGTRRFVMRNILLDGNNLAEYGLYCARTGFPVTAGKHLFDFVNVFNCTKASHLNYASEENTYFKTQFQRSPIGAIFTAYPVVADPTVIDSVPADFTATYQDATSNYIYDGAFGSAVGANPTTRCGLMTLGAQMHIYGALIQTSPSAEAGMIVDSTFGSYSELYGMQWDGFNPKIDLKVGKLSATLVNDSHRANRLILKGGTMCISTTTGTNFIEATDLRDSEIGPMYMLGALADAEKIVLTGASTDNTFKSNRYVNGDAVVVDDSAVTAPSRNMVIGQGKMTTSGQSIAPKVDMWIGPNSLFDLTATGTVFPSANAAILLAFQVQQPVTVSTAYLRVGTSSGNFDLGIYNAAGTRLGSTGATAVPTAGQTVSVALTASVNLVPGNRYYAAIAADNTTVAIAAYGAAGAPTIPGYNLRAQIAASYPLPSTIAVPANNSGLSYGIWFA